MSRRFVQPALQPRPRRFSEEQFQSWIVQFAGLQGWLVYHPFDSRKSESGWPDLVLVRGQVVLYRELKTETGKVERAQQRWLDALQHAGQDVAVWRPRDEAVIEATLRRRVGRSTEEER